MEFVEASAKTSDQVSQAFINLSRKLMAKKDASSHGQKQNVT
jgi:Ras-related protein Rab-1A